jgi:UDP-glucose 4-epimerase
MENNASRVVVTGAAGWIGRAICRELTRRGRRVVALDRVEAAGDWAEFVRHDIGVAAEEAAFAGVAARLSGASAIIHCAGYAHRPIETAEEVARFFAINRDGTARVIELARRAGVGRIVYLSSIAFYDWSRGTGFDEDGPVARPTAYAASKLDGETLCEESGLDWRVARLGTVYGTGDRANFAKLASALASGRFVIPGGGTARKSVLPVDLAAELLAELALREDAGRTVMNLALPEAPTLAEICEAYSRVCGFAAARRVPLALLRAGALAGNLVAKARPNFPLTTTNLRKLTTSTTVDTTRMERVFAGREWGSFATWLESAAAHYRAMAPKAPNADTAQIKLED